MPSPPTSASPLSVFLAASLIPNILYLHSIRFITSLQTRWGENVSHHFLSVGINPLVPRHVGRYSAAVVHCKFNQF